MENALKTFSVDVCRTGFGFASIDIEAENEYEAQQVALDVAGDHSYSEKSSEYTLVNPLPSLGEVVRQREPMELVLQVGADSVTGCSVGGVRIQVNDDILAKLSSLAEIVNRYQLSEARYSFCPESWMGGQSVEAGLVGCEVVVGKSWFRLAGEDNALDCEASSACIDIAEVKKAFDEGAFRFVVVQEAGLGFVEDSGLFDDDRGIEGLVVFGAFAAFSKSELREAFDKYRGIPSQRG